MSDEHSRLRVLLLGGTSEASALAEMLAGDGRFAPVLSLSGATKAPRLPRVACRIGGFGGSEGLAAWLAEKRIDALVDATHPFAVQITRNAVLAARACDVPFLRICRPAWQPGPGDRWISVADADAAAMAASAAVGPVLLTVGTRSLARFRDGPRQTYIVRCIDAPDPALLPFHATLLLERGPFSLPSEVGLLSRHAVGCVVTKNSGGTATIAKLQAARSLSIPVILIERPPDAAWSASVPDALGAFDWLARAHRC